MQEKRSIAAALLFHTAIVLSRRSLAQENLRPGLTSPNIYGNPLPSSALEMNELMASMDTTCGPVHSPDSHPSVSMSLQSGSGKVDQAQKQEICRLAVERNDLKRENEELKQKACCVSDNGLPEYSSGGQKWHTILKKELCLLSYAY